QVFMTKWLVDDKGVKTEGHHPASFLSVFVKLIELIDHDLIEGLPRQTLSHKKADVVDFNGIRNRHHAGDCQRERLIICTPIEDVGEAELFQQARRFERLRQSGPQPALDLMA